MFTFSNLPFLLALVPTIIWSLGQLSRLSVFDWARPVTDFLNIVLFIGPMFLFDYIGLIKFNVLNTSGGPWWHDIVFIGTTSLIFFGIGKVFGFWYTPSC